jgi:DNA processing protein
MRSSLGYALLAARLGTAWRRRSLELVWAALTPAERAHLEREVGVLAARGVRATSPDEYGPLFHVGPYDAIGPRALAVCGAREARGPAVPLAELAARLAVQAGATVIAGDTEGAEVAAVAAALDVGGLAVSVLAEGLGQDEPDGVRAAGAPSPDQPAAGVRHVTVSPCAPAQPWSVDAAIARNAAIAELCTALIAIGAAGTGATLDAGMRALAAGKPVLAVGATAGSRLLVDYGATAAVDEVELTWWLNSRLGTRHQPAA